MERNNIKDAFIKNLDPYSFRVISISDFWMQASIIVLTIEYGMSIVQVLSATTIKLGPIAIMTFLFILFSPSFFL